MAKKALATKWPARALKGLPRAALALMDEHERTKLIERLLWTILFCSGHLHHERERPDTERKYMNSDKVQRKEPELTTSWSGTVGGVTNIQSKQARVLYKS